MDERLWWACLAVAAWLRHSRCAVTKPRRSREGVLVSGASSGIGKDAALVLAEAGYVVFAGVRDAAAAAELNAVDGVYAVALDVRQAGSVRECLSHVAAVLGDAPLVALVNNAGVGGAAALGRGATEAARRVLDVNVLGMLRLTEAALPMLGPESRIVNVGSVAGTWHQAEEAAYTASKFAVEGLTDVMRVELRPRGIRVSLLQPGAVHTPGMPGGADARATTSQAVLHAVAAATPRSRYPVAAVHGVPAWLAIQVKAWLPDAAADWIATRR